MRTPTKEQFNKILLFEVFDAIARGIYLSQYCLLISQQNFTAQTGGIVSINNGAEIIKLPKEKKIIPNNIAEQIAKENKSKINIKVNFNNKELNILKKIKKRKYLEK